MAEAQADRTDLPSGSRGSDIQDQQYPNLSAVEEPAGRGEDRSAAVYTRANTTGELLIRDVHEGTTVQHIKNSFSAYGYIIEVELKRSFNETFGFITFPDWLAVEKAVSMKQVMVNGRMLTVESMETQLLGTDHPIVTKSENPQHRRHNARRDRRRNQSGQKNSQRHYDRPETKQGGRSRTPKRPKH